jgi:hypothetical protein
VTQDTSYPSTSQTQKLGSQATTFQLPHDSSVLRHGAQRCVYANGVVVRPPSATPTCWTACVGVLLGISSSIAIVNGHFPAGKSPFPSQAWKNSAIARSGPVPPRLRAFGVCSGSPSDALRRSSYLVRYTVKLFSSGSVGPRAGRSSNSHGSPGELAEGNA